jgi:hypothetical protein
MLTHQELVKKVLSDRVVSTAYDDQAEEFVTLDKSLRARSLAALTHIEVAKKMEKTMPSTEEPKNDLYSC